MHVSWMTFVALFALFGASVAFFVMFAAVPPLLYGVLARRARRGYVAGKIGVWVAGIAVGISVPLWIWEAWLAAMEGTSLRTIDPTLPPFRGLAVAELAVLAVAVLVFRWRRKRWRAEVSSRP